MTIASARRLWAGREVVYRLYQDDRLIYVGHTKDLVQRLRTHESDQWWWPLVTWVDFRVFPTRAAAHEAEQEAIREELPAFNVRVAGEPDRLSRDHWSAEEHAMAEQHRRAMYVRNGFDPDTLERLPERPSPRQLAAWASQFAH